MTAGESTLLIDMGNSRVKWALANESTRDVGEPFANRGSDTDFSLLDTVPRPAKIVVANTAGEACASILSAWCNRVWGLAPQFLKSPARQGGLRNSYADPQALGVDRWLAMVAARQTREGAFAVVDCGTAITVDAVSSDGDFLGGVISAGPATSLRALTNSVNHLRADTLEYAGALNINTASALASGALIFAVGGIERVLLEFEDTLGGDLHVVLTGGDSSQIADLMDRSVEHCPHLVLEGLQFAAGQASE